MYCFIIISPAKIAIDFTCGGTCRGGCGGTCGGACRVLVRVLVRGWLVSDLMGNISKSNLLLQNLYLNQTSEKSK